MPIKFTEHKECNYKFEYAQIFDDMAALSDKQPEQRRKKLETYRNLIVEDLWFIVFGVMGIPEANSPFVVNVCREIEDGRKNFTLDIWAREHFKTSIISVAETLQLILKKPDSATAIFSATFKLAKKILFTLKQLMESNDLLKACFPDVLWENPSTDAPKWSINEGLVVKRKSSRGEPTISAWGLSEGGMPTGYHFDRRVYDDITKEDIIRNYELMDEVKTKFDLSQSLGRDGGHHRVVGTFYHHEDPVVHVLNIKDAITGKPKYLARVKPATEDGDISGKPVLFSQEYLDDLKHTRTFPMQYLCNPTPSGMRNYNSDMIHPIDRKFIPRELYNVMLIDQAGDNTSGDGDPWAILSLGVGQSADEGGANDVYIKDFIIERMRQADAIDTIARMYLNAGVVRKLGVEKAGLSTTEIHIANALKKYGRTLSVDRGNLVLLTPAGRSKDGRVSGNLDWPLLNNKIHYADDIPSAYIDKAKAELDRFPFCEYHFLDALAYLYDIIKDCSLSRGHNSAIIRKIRHCMPKPVNKATGW